MLQDRFSGAHSFASSRAVEAFERAVHAVLAHRPGAAAALQEALDDSPDFLAARALRGFCNVTLARRETLAAAKEEAQALAALHARCGGAPGETALVMSLALAAQGGLQAAADRLDAYLTDAPDDLLALKLSHALRFLSGDAPGMLRTTSAALRGASPGREGYGFLLGCHAFALEENDFLHAAESCGREAVEREAADAWGAHAVGHVHEMRGDAEAGRRWLSETRPIWSGCNNFGGHMAWHLALCHLERGDIGEALALYDQQVRAAPTDDFRDVANAVSLLWRLRQTGVDAGGRWDELAEIARRRAEDTTLVFASLHCLLALVAVDDRAGVERLVANWTLRARAGADDQARVARDAGLEAARALAGGRADDPVALAERLSVIGGSRAQRDVFVRTLAAQAREATMAEALLALRCRPAPDAFARDLRARLQQQAAA